MITAAIRQSPKMSCHFVLVSALALAEVPFLTASDDCGVRELCFCCLAPQYGHSAFRTEYS
ncbi:MAG: hypothetical protein CVU91_04915 [Firmicutes bacterium HGW-Firmicutes-16]|nr:MAG: hypothetical protein CVU91_04915 [Firmicutes bacterium HGW-Firmicutes-16]